MSFPEWNSDASWNKITSSYFRDTIDLSGNFIIRNGTIKSPANTIEFDDTYSFINFLNSVNIYGQQKLTYNAIEYDVGLQCEKVDTLVSDVATLSPIVSDTAFKCTNFYYDQALNSTIFSNNVSFGNGTIASIAINNTSFVDLSTAQTILGIKTFNSAPVMSGASITNGSIPSAKITGTACNLISTQTISGLKTFSVLQTFTNNIRLDGSLLVGTAGGTVITNSLLQQIADIPTLKTITTAISYTPLTTTTLITGILQFSGTLNGWDTTNFYNAINYSKSATSDLQTQINSLNTNSVSLSASNIFTGSTNQFSNTLRLDGSLVVNANGTTLTNSTLNKIQYLSNVSSDINTSITNLNTSVSTLNTKTTKMSYMSVGGINTTTISDGLISQTFSFTGTINNINTTTFGYISGLTSSAQTQISNLATKLTDISYSASTTTIANNLVFTGTLNNIIPTVFSYLSNLSGNIQDQLNNLSTRITNVELVGTIIMSPLYDLQTTTNNKYLMCNGQAVSRTTYSALFAKFETQFGEGNGTTTFGLPNYSAIFLRGMGNQIINGVNYGNYNSTYSPDQDSIQNHTHSGQSGSFLGTVNIQVSPSYRTGTGDSPNAYTFSNTGGMATGRINDNETKPVSMGIYYYVRT